MEKRFKSKLHEEKDFIIIVGFLKLLTHSFNIIKKDSLIIEQEYRKDHKSLDTYVGGIISGEVK